MVEDFMEGAGGGEGVTIVDGVTTITTEGGAGTITTTTITTEGGGGVDGGGGGDGGRMDTLATIGELTTVVLF